MDNIYNIEIILNSKELEIQLRNSFKHSFLITAIEKLESLSLSTEEQIGILNSVKEKVKNENIYYLRYKKIIEGNPDINYFINFNALKIPSREKHYSYFPLTSVDVERSFGNFKHIFSDKRQRLNIKNIETLLMLYCNKYF